MEVNGVSFLVLTALKNYIYEVSQKIGLFISIFPNISQMLFQMLRCLRSFTINTNKIESFILSLFYKNGSMRFELSN